jgi:hypothetical protein
MPARSALRFGSIALAAVLAACSQFKESKKFDPAPFAENTISMAGEIQRYNRPPPWVYLNEYRLRPSVETARKSAVELRDLLRTIALYSTQVVALHEARIGERQRVAELARYIDEASRPAVASGSSRAIGVTDAEYDSILRSIRSKETLREALGAAQPLVNAVAKHAGDLFDRADVEVADACEDVTAQIESKFRPLLDNLRELDAHQMRLTKAFGLVCELRGGRPDARPALLETAPEVRDLLSGEGEPSYATLEVTEGRLFAELGRVKAVRDQLEPQFVQYKEHERELETLRIQTEEMLRLGRLTIALWTRSHRNLTAGIPIPPEYDVVGILQNAAKLGKLVL